MIHNLKAWPCYFQGLVSKTKTFEYRKDDRDFKNGDILVLQEYEACSSTYTGKSVLRKVTFIIKGNKHSMIPEGFCVMSIVPLDED